MRDQTAFNLDMNFSNNGEVALTLVDYILLERPRKSCKELLRRKVLNVGRLKVSDSEDGRNKKGGVFFQCYIKSETYKEIEYWMTQNFNRLCT